MKKILIANRGEIACRIIKTAKRMGWQTVAVYSSADAGAMHTTLADEAFLIGDPPPTSSYLNHQVILEVAKNAGVTAIHPGYGFLSENPTFAEKCVEADIAFVGPPFEAVNIMGLKGIARARMEAVGVPVLPGINKITEQTTAAEIAEIGFPVLIKPEAGGGGKGMKIVHNAKDLSAALESAKREALSAFGNDSLMVEKYLLKPRHIEIQVFADSFGQCIHLNERDCSLQRRHQKIVEESPAPDYSDALRQTMGAAAVAAAQAINYVGAGTVEFLLSDNNDFYFMEMNTRLQVEHPVTEMITGIDLVEWQIRIAMGEKLPCQQKDITIQGHAVEVRLYAEDPSNEFLPVAGRITQLALPDSGPHLRIDSGVQAQDNISVYYDPMMMKLISWGEDRAQSIAQLKSALCQLHIAGIRTNRDFLIRMISHPPFHLGGLGTDYLDNHLSDILQPISENEQHIALAALTIYLSTQARYSPAHPTAVPWLTETGFRLNGPAIEWFEIESMQSASMAKISVEVDNQHFLIGIDAHQYRCQFFLQDNVISLDVHQQQYCFKIHQTNNIFTLFDDTNSLEFSLPNEALQQDEDQGSLQAPMTGRIVSILVAENAQVNKGDQLAVIEAMKMEHVIIAPDNGIITKVHFSEAELVNEGIALFDFEAQTEDK
ncbi:MAG: ATP-grasp domain-containing protein [Pseudomonadales bacterium]|nr:ATP-grasp domain-containing protein [Pseudomonadales bacterium]